MPDLIEESLEGAERVQKIVQNLKLFTRAENTAGFAYADINETLENALALVWNEHRHKAAVATDYDGQLPRVWCHLGQLNQVFMSLLVNAAQAIPEQGEIRIRTCSDGDQVRIEISDTGCGMEEETLARIFDPFFTTKEVGQGVGLGLAMAYD
ncbi:MAG: ATP-binding protein, partial [Desulfuromonadaceae bacterium]